MITHANSLVANSKDLLCIGAHDEIQVSSSGRFEIVLLHRLGVRKGEIEAFAAPKEVRIVRDGVSLKRPIASALVNAGTAKLLTSVGV